MNMDYPKIGPTAHNFTLRFAVHHAGHGKKAQGALDFCQFIREHGERPGLNGLRCGDFDESVPALQHVEAFKAGPDSGRVPRFLVEMFVFVDRPIEEQFEETRAALAAGGWEANLY